MKKDKKIKKVTKKALKKVKGGLQVLNQKAPVNACFAAIKRK
jgi:hypothetical protein